ncbi:hypothetical protein [Streptomyces canus]|uniref:hypothetical protein n=1 Tax=Streptomyces canus TaxID=58343 RepID=UPI0033B5B626
MVVLQKDMLDRVEEWTEPARCVPVTTGFGLAGIRQQSVGRAGADLRLSTSARGTPPAAARC